MDIAQVSLLVLAWVIVIVSVVKVVGSFSIGVVSFNLISFLIFIYFLVVDSLHQDFKRCLSGVYRVSFLSNGHRLVSDLNGNNGSWTNSDDVNDIAYEVEQAETISMPMLHIQAMCAEDSRFLCPYCNRATQRKNFISEFVVGCRDCDEVFWYTCKGVPYNHKWFLVESLYVPLEDEFDVVVENLLEEVEEYTDLELPDQIALTFYVPSQINGSNGEWTNTDDLADINAENKRRKKEADNKKKNSSTTQHKNKDGSLPKINKPCFDFAAGKCERGDKCRFSHEPPALDPPVVEQVVHEKVDKPKEVFVFQYNSWLSHHQLHDRSLQDGLEFPDEWDLEGDHNYRVEHDDKFAQPGDQPYYFRDFRNGIRFITVPEKLLPSHDTLLDNVHYHVVDVSKKSEIIDVPSFVQFGQTYGGTSIFVHAYFYEALVDRLGILPNEPRNHSTLFRAVRELLPNMPTYVVESTMIYYAYKNSLRNQSSTLTPKSEVVVNTNKVVNSGDRIILPMAESPQVDYKWNAAWGIASSEGFKMDVNPDNTFKNYPEFKTSTPIKITPRNKRAFFWFTPHINFQYYADIGKNVTRAMARYFKERCDDEDWMCRNQMRLASCFDEDVWTDCAKLCGAEYKRDGYQNHMLKTRKVTKRTGQPKENKYYVVSPLSGGTNFRKVLDAMTEQRTYSVLEMIREKMKSAYESTFNVVIDYVYSPLHWWYDRTDILRNFVTLPHPKRLLYQKYVLDDATLFRILMNQGEFESKFKWEAGKFKKVGRLYATAGHLCLADNIGADILKQLFAKGVDFVKILGTAGTKRFYDWYPTSFIAKYCDCQQSEQSDRLFREASQVEEGGFMYLFFSDDGFAIMRRNGVLSIYETDISSCDASNKFAVFAAVKQLSKSMGLGGTIDMLLAQCARTTTVRNPCEYSEYVRLTPETFFEYSGSRLTTVLNNIASLAIALGAFENLISRPYGTDFGSCLIAGARAYGWILEVALKDTLNAVTFLKRSFNGKRSWKVYGCILRSFGLTDGEPTQLSFGLPYLQFKQMTDSQLTEVLIRQTADGLQNEPGSLLINAIRERAGLKPYPEIVTISDLQSRYGGELYEWDLLRDAILGLRLGDIVRLSILERIFNVDYGVTPTFDVEDDIYRQPKKLPDVLF